MTKYQGLIATYDGKVVCGANGDAILFRSKEQAEKAKVPTGSEFLRVVKSPVRVKKEAPK